MAHSRSYQMSIGMILASIVISGKPRLLLLRSNGEVWPVSPPDVQFVMPSSLIQPQIARECWTPELVELWARGEEAQGAEIEAAMAPMQEARRQAVMILRKIIRETERMSGKMMGGIGRDRFGGIEGVWDAWAPEDVNTPASITSAEAAEFILNANDSEQHIKVRPNTLPAYAAHCLMMARSDLFLADSGSMWASGKFMIRSRAQRARTEQATHLIDGVSVEDKKVLDQFIKKARATALRMRQAREENQDQQGYELVETDLPEWTEEEKSILAVITSRLYETRSTQSSVLDSLPTRIMKTMEIYGEQIMDRALIPQFISDLGILRPWDTFKRSEMAENEARAMATAGTSASPAKNPEDGLLKGTELDDIRHDFTSHKVFVVDDASATELDDGIAVERIPGSEDVWVHVHVADPTRYIPLSSPIATQASFRGSSLYLPEGNVPLFPIDVIMKELSLGAKGTGPDGAQGAMTFSAKLTPKGEVSDSAVRMGWIKNPTVVTYNAVNEALGVSGHDVVHPLGTPSAPRERATKEETVLSSEDVEDLKLLQRVALAFRHHRLRNAGFEWMAVQGSLKVRSPIPPFPTNIFDPTQLPDKPEIYTGTPVIDYTLERTSDTFTSLPSRSIIAEMMVLAGRTAASFCSSRGLPVPYRVTYAPTPTALPGMRTVTLDDLLATRDPNTLVIDRYTLAAANLAFSPGEMSLKPDSHWVMGFNDQNGYIRATSPLRRFDDMLVHWQIKSALVRESSKVDQSLAPEISSADVETLMVRSDAPQRKGRKASYVASAWWEAGLFASRLRNPRPEEYTFTQDAVDLNKPLVGRVAGPTVYGTTSSANTTPVYIPSLGATARMPGLGKVSFKVGDELNVKISNAQQWPVPIVDVKMV